MQDMTDTELRRVLIASADKCGLAFEDSETVATAVQVVSQQRRMPGFGNAGSL